MNWKLTLKNRDEPDFAAEHGSMGHSSPSSVNETSDKSLNSLRNDALDADDALVMGQKL